LRNFHTKLDFLRKEFQRRDVQDEQLQENLVFFHQQRNEQYHKGSYSTPNLDLLKELRDAAIRVFSVLYEIERIEEELEAYVSELVPPKAAVTPSKTFDRALDDKFGYVEIAGIPFRTSEALFMIDSSTYVEQAQLAIMQMEEINGDAS